jgi:hypothetical protein
MLRKSSRIAQLILLASALGLGTGAAAALKDKPPKGVALPGTHWLIDPHRSDDPDVAIERAHKEEQQEQKNSAEDAMDRGVMGDDGPLGRGYGNDSTWGGGFPTGGRNRDDLPGRVDDRGGWRNDRGRTSTDIDPTGRKQSGSITLGSAGSRRSEFLGQLMRNPQTLSFRESTPRLSVSEDKLETDCVPGAKEAISDSYGDGERRCGWQGRAWVIETTRGKHFTRIDRFEVSKDGKTLNYVTTASGAQVPKVRISRTYTLAPPAPAAS